MRKSLLVALLAAAGAAALGAVPAQAAGGCGWGYHPAPYGCRANYRPRIIAYAYRPVYHPRAYWGWYGPRYGW